MDTQKQVFVKNIAKILPSSIKVVEFSRGFYKNREGVEPRDLWIDPLQYDQYIKNKKLRRSLSVVDDVLLPPVYNLSFGFYNDAPSKALQDHFNSLCVLPIEKDASEALQSSIRRTRRIINEYAKCNAFDMFCTFTFDGAVVDRYDIKECKRVFSQWLNREQKAQSHLGKFQYMVVPEFHKDGALHFHALFQNYKGSYSPALNPYTGLQIKHHHKKVYNFNAYTYTPPQRASSPKLLKTPPRLGFNHFTRIQSKTGLANYITKYITKDMPLVSGTRRYWVSQGLKKPLVIYNSDYVNDPRLSEVYSTESYKISYIDLQDSHIKKEAFQPPPLFVNIPF